jgi:hypothetical protein
VTSNQPSHLTRRGLLSFLRSPWASPVFLMPFLLMLAVHQVLGLSDALLADDSGERPAHGYNLLLGINMNLCPLAAILHLLAKSQRVLPWIIAKLLIPTILFVLAILTM